MNAPRLWSNPNPYCARSLIRVDAIIHRLAGRRVRWYHGVLCEQMPKGHGVELLTHFPGWMHVAAAKIQNRWLWTRKLLSL